MTEKTTFDYREFVQKGFDSLDDDFLNEHFGEYAIVKSLGKHEAKPNNCMDSIKFDKTLFVQHIFQKLTTSQQEGLKSGDGCVDVHLVDDNTGKSYTTKLVVDGELYYLEGIEEFTKDFQITKNQQFGLGAHDGILHFKCL